MIQGYYAGIGWVPWEIWVLVVGGTIKIRAR
jgi:hypothetical protein